MPTYETPNSDFTLSQGILVADFQDPMYGYVQPEATFGAPDSDLYTLGEFSAGASDTVFVGGAIDEQIQAGVSQSLGTENQTIAEGEKYYPSQDRNLALYQTSESGNGDYLEVPFTALSTATHGIAVQDIGGGSSEGFVDAPAPYVITFDPQIAANFTQEVRNGTDTVPVDDTQVPDDDDRSDSGSDEDGDDSGNRIDLSGQDQVTGTTAIDIAVADQGRDAYTVTRRTDDTIDLGGASNVTLDGVERIEFADGTLGFDDTALRAYRLYEAAFNRDPDEEGLGYWIDEVDQGMGFDEVQRRFLNSDEFKDAYGASTSGTEFVELLYQNVLDRGPDDAGRDYWLGELAGGMSREQVLGSFAQSDENVQALQNETDTGVFFA